MTNNESQSKEYAIPMELTDGTIGDFGIDLSKVVWTKIGNKNVRAYIVPCTKEQYYEYMRPLWREDKNVQNREAMEALDFEPKDVCFTEEQVVDSMVLDKMQMNDCF